MNETKKEKTKEIFSKIRELLDYKSLKEFTITRKYAFKTYTSAALQKLPKNIRDDYRRSPLLNNVFKTVFENEGNKDLTAILLSPILGYDIDYLIENMKFYKNDINQESVDEIQRKGDLAVYLNGILIDVEMNNTAKPGRNYLYRVKTAIKEEDTSKDIRINPTIVVNINNYAYKEIDNWYGIYALLNVDKDSQDYLMVKTIYVEIYLAKLKELEYNGLELSEEARTYLTLFETSLEKAERYAKGDELLMEYNKKLKKMTNSPDYIGKYDYERESFEDGKIVGYEEGVENGIEQNQCEVIKNMLVDNLPVSTISKYVKLPVKEVESLIKTFKENEKLS